MITRAQLVDELSLTPSAPTKTYVLEVHAPPGPDLLTELAGVNNVHQTQDAYLFATDVKGGRFWVDQIDDRFWSFHTSDISARDAQSFLKAGVDTRRDLDWMWLPSAHLRSPWPGAVIKGVQTSFRGTGFVSAESPTRDFRIRLSGQDADTVFSVLESDSRYRGSAPFDSVQATIEDTDFGSVEEGVNRHGRFAVSGDSLELHLELVRSVVARYRRLITACEDRILNFTAHQSPAGEGGGTLTGAPIVVRFSRPIPDVSDFLAELLSSREPFRLWGSPQASGDTTVVEAVDLHVGQRMRLELGDQWLRIYLQPNSCGNTVARLVSNLQHTFDGALTFADADLDAALSENAIAAV